MKRKFYLIVFNCLQRRYLNKILIKVFRFPPEDLALHFLISIRKTSLKSICANAFLYLCELISYFDLHYLHFELVDALTYSEFLKHHSVVSRVFENEKACCVGKVHKVCITKPN